MEGKAPMKTSWKAYKSRNEGRMNEEWKKNDEGWMLKDDDFKLLRGFADLQTNRRTFVNVEINSTCHISYGRWTVKKLMWQVEFIHQ